jgi:hypothetical protein
MPRLIKSRHTEPEPYRARDQKRRIIDSHRVKRCGTCTFEFPEEDMVVEDGQERCPMCRDLYTAEWLADEQQRVADVQTESALLLNDPAQYSVRALQESKPGIVTLITDSAGNTLSQSSPLFMPRTVAKTVLLVGQRFTAANLTTYPAGITDNSPPILTPTLITLSLIAAVGMTPGSYGITMADGVTQIGHVYPYILSVR